MKLKIFLTATLIFFLTAVKVEAAETFGVLDIISRVVITNLKGDVVQTFPNARHEMLAELTQLLVTPGKVEMIDMGSEFQIAAIDEQTIMQQLGTDKTTQTNFAACNYLMFMYLTNCNVVKDDHIITKGFAVTVDLSARIIDRRTGKCVFVATGSGTSKAKDTRALGLFKFKTFECPEEQFYEAIKIAVHDLATKIRAKM